MDMEKVRLTVSINHDGGLKVFKPAKIRGLINFIRRMEMPLLIMLFLVLMCTSATNNVGLYYKEFLQGQKNFILTKIQAMVTVITKRHLPSEPHPQPKDLHVYYIPHTKAAGMAAILTEGLFTHQFAESLSNAIFKFTKPDAQVSFRTDFLSDQTIKTKEVKSDKTVPLWDELAITYLPEYLPEQLTLMNKIILDAEPQPMAAPDEIYDQTSAPVQGSQKDTSGDLDLEIEEELNVPMAQLVTDVFIPDYINLDDIVIQQTAVKVPENKFKDLKSILRKYHGSGYAVEKIAYQRVNKLKTRVENITVDYDNSRTELMLAVIKAETQGRMGLESHRKAVGLTQIKYQGAFAFIWNAWFKKHINIRGKKIKDYYNSGKRQRYRSQLQRIRKYMHKNNLIVLPSNHKAAKKKTWLKLKKYLKKAGAAQTYLVDVDIAAMYLDHLVHSFSNCSAEAFQIKTYIQIHPEQSIESIRFQGTRQIYWKAFKKAMHRELMAVDRKGKLLAKISQKDTKMATLRKIRKLIIKRLDYIKVKTGDPKTWYAAYNVGPSLILSRIKKKNRLPYGPYRYADRVDTYIRVFDEIHRRQQNLISNFKERKGYGFN